jgi:ubiquinone/menaquinone biosynthesis C-methylase UbiE
MEKQNSDIASLYQQYNAFQTEKGINLIKQLQLQPGAYIVDLGCGTGELTYELAKKTGPSGKIFALDPDSARLKVAKDNQPADLQNIEWSNSTIESFSLPENTIDIVFSNYVLHWVSDKKIALSQIHNLLKPQGQLGINCIADYSQIIADLSILGGLTDDEFKQKYPLTQKQEWLALLTDFGFKVLENKTIEDFAFNSLDEFLIFWEATTKGEFKCHHLSDDNYTALLKKYPNQIKLFGNETLNVSCRSEK